MPRSPSPVFSLDTGPFRRTTLITVTILALLMLALVGCGPRPPAPQPDASRQAVDTAAAALDKRDVAAFTQTLSAPLREAAGGHLDLSGPGTAQLARVLRDAKLIAEYEDVRVYEAKVGDRTYSFYAVKEDGKWLLSGF